MIEGFILYEAILDSEGNLKDLRYVEVNEVLGERWVYQGTKS